jgi:hypothetical protein
MLKPEGCLPGPRGDRANWVRTISAVLLIVAGAAPASGLVHERGYGEPVGLLGKRLVFTTWAMVRPGQPDWQDEQGKSVFADKGVKAGPFDAHWKNIDGPWGIRLVAEPAQRVHPVITMDMPWETGGAGVDVKTLLIEGGKYRMWGSCRAGACYWESTDAKTWTRPHLGLVEFEGSKENNLIPSLPGVVWVDPIGSREERYKAVNNGDYDPKRFEAFKTRRPFSQMALEPDPGRVHAVFGFTSPDGFHWKQIEEPLSVEVSDTAITAYYDVTLKKYVVFTRTYMVPPRAEGQPLRHERWHQFASRRAIGRTESDQFQGFPLSQVVVESGPDMAPTDTWYTSCYTTIPGMPEGHLMFPWRYTQASDGAEIDLLTSVEGKAWHRVPGSPVFQAPPFGQFDSGCLAAYPNLVEKPDGDWVIPYTGYAYPHKYPRGAWSYGIGMMLWPKGRLIALEAPVEGGFTTLAFLLPGTKLRINAVTQRTGHVLVEVADFNGKPMPGRTFEDAVPVIGDQHYTLVRWNKHDTTGVKTGEPIILRFRLKAAKIFGLQFE